LPLIHAAETASIPRTVAGEANEQGTAAAFAGGAVCTGFKIILFKGSP
jgi:hypothetical protein